MSRGPRAGRRGAARARAGGGAQDAARRALAGAAADEAREEAAAIERAVAQVLEQNARTADLVTGGDKHVTTTEMGDLIVAAIDNGN